MPCSKKWACTLTCKLKTADWLAGLTFISAVWLLSLSSKKISSISTFSRSCIKVILLPSPSTWLPAEETCCTVGLQKMVWFFERPDGLQQTTSYLLGVTGWLHVEGVAWGLHLSPEKLDNRDRPSSFKPFADSGCFLGLYPAGELLRSSVVNVGTLWGPSEPDQQHPCGGGRFTRLRGNFAYLSLDEGTGIVIKLCSDKAPQRDENFLWNMDGFWCCWLTHLFSVVLKVRDSDCRLADVGGGDLFFFF